MKKLKMDRNIGRLYYCKEYKRLLKVVVKNEDCDSDTQYMMEVLKVFDSNERLVGLPIHDWNSYPSVKKHLKEGKNYINWDLESLTPLIKKTRLTDKLCPKAYNYGIYIIPNMEDE